LGCGSGLVAGEETMVGGALVMAAAAAGVWYGKLDPVSGLTLLGIGLSIAGFSAKANATRRSC